MRDSDRFEETIRGSKMDSDHGPRECPKPNQAAIPPRVWIFALIAAVLLFALFGFWGLYAFRGRFGAQAPTPTAIIWTPTASPTGAATPAPTATKTEGDEEVTSATPTASADIAIGGYVEVVGTGGYGLSLREGPGANYARLAIAAEGRVFVVAEGPATAGGTVWWRIHDPKDEDQSWWAVANYLQPVGRP